MTDESLPGKSFLKAVFGQVDEQPAGSRNTLDQNAPKKPLYLAAGDVTSHVYTIVPK